MVDRYDGVCRPLSAQHCSDDERVFQSSHQLAARMAECLPVASNTDQGSIVNCPLRTQYLRPWPIVRTGRWLRAAATASGPMAHAILSNSQSDKSRENMHHGRCQPEPCMHSSTIFRSSLHEECMDGLAYLLPSLPYL